MRAVMDYSWTKVLLMIILTETFVNNDVTNDPPVHYNKL